MRNERGTVLILVAFALLSLLVFSGFIVDNGIMYVARRQAQTAADAGALAGALTLLTNPTAYGNATLAAKQIGGGNPIWGQGTAATDIVVWPLPYNCPNDGKPACIRVDIMRGQPDAQGNAHTNTIPTYFVSMAGIATQGVRATATAQVAGANTVRCIRPWVVADKWTDTTTGAAGGLTSNDWDQMDTFDPAGDSYTPGTSGFKATGTPTNDYGLQLVLKAGVVGEWSSGWTMEIDLGRTGSAPYEDEIEGCPDWVPEVGLYNPTTTCDSRTDENPPKGCVGVKTGMSQGPTSHGVEILVGLDRNASWNTSSNEVQGGCMTTGGCLDADGHPVGLSPRIVPLAIFNPASYVAGGFNGTNGVAQVMNLLGFFVEGMCNDVYPDPATRPPYCGTPAEANKMVVGRLMNYPGQNTGIAGSAGPATFLKVVRLIR